MGQTPDSQNLSIMITDIQGFSKFSSGASREDLMELIKTHSELLTPAIHFFKGRIIKSMGDSFLSTFSSATDAAICAIAIRLITAEYNKFQKDEKLKLSIRIIINSGDVSLSDNDIFGEPVNIAARMEKIPQFENGGIGISESTYLLMNRQEIIAKEVGEFNFKGVNNSIKVYSIDLQNQKLENLPTKLLRLVEDIASGKGVPKDKSASASKSKKHLTWAAAGLTALAVVSIMVIKLKPNKLTRSPATAAQTQAFINTEDGPGNEKRPLREIIKSLRASSKNENGEFTREGFAGTEELFKSLDANNDGVLERREIRSRIEALGGPSRPPRNGPFKNRRQRFENQ